MRSGDKCCKQFAQKKASIKDAKKQGILASRVSLCREAIKQDYVDMGIVIGISSRSV